MEEALSLSPWWGTDPRVLLRIPSPSEWGEGVDVGVRGPRWLAG